MTVEDQVRKATNAQTAMLFLAQALDRIEAKLAESAQPDPWELQWNDAPIGAVDPAEWEQQPVKVEYADDETVIELPPVGPERHDSRILFAENTLQINEYAKHANGWDDGHDWVEVYARGGPAWLYNADREFVMSLPFGARQQLVADLEQDDPKAAHEMSRDILKRESETSPGNGVGPDPSF